MFLHFLGLAVVNLAPKSLVKQPMSKRVVCNDTFKASIGYQFTSLNDHIFKAYKKQETATKTCLKKTKIGLDVQEWSKRKVNRGSLPKNMFRTLKGR